MLRLMPAQANQREWYADVQRYGARSEETFQMPSVAVVGGIEKVAGSHQLLTNTKFKLL